LVAVAAARHPDHPAVVDELGTLTYGELDRNSAAIAAGLREGFDVGGGCSLAVMCRNHRGFVEAMAAGSRCGADLLSLNTELRASQLGPLLDRFRPAAVVHDQEFATVLDEAGFPPGARVVAWGGDGAQGPTLDALSSRADVRNIASRRQGKLVLLTSGTTGTPKSAPRSPSARAVLGPTTTLLERVPFRAREPMMIATPLFHGFAFAFLALGLFLGSTIVVRRGFDAEATLAAVSEHGVTTMIAVPVMLQRILQLSENERNVDAGSLRIVLSAAAPLSGDLSRDFMGAFGEVLYNGYGSTEIGFGAIATPSDLRAAPGTVGRATHGATVKILGEDRAELAAGRTGHVFIGGDLVFEGYTGGGSKETVDGLMNTGDLGHLDREGRLFIEGREDDMIVSGGENVFPQEVEDVLRGHDGVADVAVIGMEDSEFGQRLEAFVVRRTGVDVSEDELTAHVKENLERYKVPRSIVFIEELPRNAMGKVLRSRLAIPSSTP
jgi:fatty-acyl-CoA synthase